MKHAILYKSLLTLVFLVFASLLSARQLSVSEAVARMQSESGKTMRKVAGNAKALSLVRTESVNGQNTMYILNRSGEDGGVVMLSADDCAPAVLGWTDSGTVGKDSVPDALRWWIAQYSNQIALASASGTTLRKIAIENPTVDALLPTEWGQTYPYYNYCTDLGQNTYTGCVATAMAQIMKYHRWPVTGTGSHSYQCTSGSETVEISSDFSTHTYDWDNMLDTYPYYSGFGTTEAQENAVALLMRDCGVSVDMGYSSSGSGASNNMVAHALSTYFGYDKGMQNVYRDFCTDEEWTQYLIDELNAKRPVIYSGSSNYEGGHCFVCDGYDASGYFHINWGWNGSYNGFFQVIGDDQLHPYTYTTDTGYNFSNSQMICIGIKPDEGGEAPKGSLAMPSGYSLSTNAIDRSGYFYFSSNYMINTGTETLNAQLGVMLKCGDEVYYASESGTGGNYALGYYYMPSFYIYGSNFPKNGTYEVYPVFRDLSEKNPKWQRVLVPAGTTVPTLTITGTEADALIASQPYAYSSGKRLPSGKVTTDGLTLHIELEFLQDVSSKYLSAYIYDANSSGYNMAYISKSVTTTAGQRLAFDVQPTLYSGSSFEVGKEYKVKLYFNNKTLAPSDYEVFYFTVVDHLPTISDVTKAVKTLPDGTTTKADVLEIVDEILTTEEVK